MAISDRDRKRLWGKSGNRCAHCRRLLTHPGQAGGREAIVGVEAHVIGERPGAARYRPLPASSRDAYENRILLCPTDHRLVDEQPEVWTVEKLIALKHEHERTMTFRTGDARGDGLQFDMPRAVRLDPVVGGRQLLNIVGPAFAYVFDCDELEGEAEHEAAKDLLGEAHDCGEIYSDLSPAEHVDLARGLSERLRAAMEASLLLFGGRVTVDVVGGNMRDRWPVSILHLRRAADVAREQAAAREAEQASRDRGLEELESWAERMRSQQRE